MSFSPSGIAVICFIAILVGITKTGVPGIGNLLVPLAALAMPARESTGFILPILVAGDCLAVAYWRRKVIWPHLLRILPYTIAGIVAGYFLMGRLSESSFRPILGGMILGVIGLDLLRRWAGLELRSDSRVYAIVTGVLAGAFTMIANAAGPIMTVYLLSMGLPKEEFVGTGAWFFFIINLCKVPFSVALGLITWQSFLVNLYLVPLVALGGLVGILVIKKLPQKVFDFTAQALAAIGGIKLFF